MSDADLDREMGRRLEELGYELVDLERAGDRRRPILRLRIDHLEGTAEVTIDDCTRASRALEPFLDEHPGLPATYVLEVSSPGVERPLVRDRDFERFAGREVLVQGREALAGRARRLSGELLGLRDGGLVALRLSDGEEIEVPRAEISKANLVFRWGGGERR
ncbi:MAG TPA: ribosome maturation factor RimP [Longimicrobiaceae bacterium]|nr:ribosome maturation factor RimP [Longimicrobiaceae bacterium]